MTSRLDQILYRTVTRGWDTATVDGYSRAVHSQDEALPGTTAAFQTIDAKAGGTLTHVSMMIAGLGLIAPMVATNRVEEAIIVGQIAVYLLIAVGCLRCLSVFAARELSGAAADMARQLHRELIIRRELYAVCNRVAIGFTVFVFVSLPPLFIWE